MKKCKYCQSKIDAKAKICPHCRKRQSKTHIYIILIVFIIGIILTLAIINIVKDSKKYLMELKANEFFNRVSAQYISEDWGEEIMCYRIDEEEYLGSIQLEYDEDNNEISQKIWLTNGKYYVSGVEENLSIVKSNKTATTNCYND